MAALSKAEVVDLLRRDTLTIAFDTNAIFGNTKDDPALRLCDLINQINRLRESPPFSSPHIRKVLPAPVFVEKIHDLRQIYGESYDHQKILGVLTTKVIDVVGFAQQHAEHTAAMLGRLYPNEDAWQGFKRQQCARCLGLQVPVNAPKKKKCSATIDWLIAGHADADGLLLVTADSRGGEFREVKLQTTLGTLEASAERVHAELEEARKAVMSPGEKAR